MAKVKVSGIQDALKGVELAINNSIRHQQFLTEIKDFSVLRIQAETRKGKDLTQDGEKQPDLRKGYIEYRRRLKSGRARNRSRTGPSTIRPDPNFMIPAKSNLTLTGQLLNAIRGTVFSRKSEIQIIIAENRNDGQSNSKIVKDLRRRGRTFFGMDRTGIRLIRKYILDEIRRSIKREGFV